MSSASLLPIGFTVLIGGLTHFWWRMNSAKLGAMSEAVWVGLLLSHLVSITGLATITLGAVWSPTHWVFVIVGVTIFIISLMAKITQVNDLPLDLWHFTERNRRLVAEGRIVRFHLENDFAALAPVIPLVTWLVAA